MNATNGRPRKKFCMKNRNGIFYVKLLDWPDYRTTGSKKKTEAENLALEWLRQGIEFRTEVASERMRFGAFVDGFYDSNSPYVTERRAKGFEIGDVHLYNQSCNLKMHILPRFKDMQLDSITRSEINSWLISLNLSNGTKNHLLSSLNAIFGFAVELDLIKSSPSEPISRFKANPKERKILELEEFHNLIPLHDLRYFQTIWDTWHWACYFSVLATTGVREGEVKALRWKDLVEIDGRIYIPVDKAVSTFDQIGDTKTKGKGWATIIPQVAELLRLHKESTPFPTGDDDLIFTSTSGTPVKNRTALAAFRRGLRKAGIELGGRNVVLHSLRHGFVTYMDESGVPREVTMTSTNHTSDKMMDNYSHTNNRMKLKVLNGYADVITGVFVKPPEKVEEAG